MDNSNNNIPKITTRQTEYLRDQYPSLSHLEAGNIAEWLQERKDQLFEQARSVEGEADTARVLGLAAAGIGTICYAVNPFMLIGGMIGGAAWLWFVIEHHARTKEIAPLPFVRGNFVDALARAGDYDTRQSYREDHLANTIKFLPRHDAEEYVFLYSDQNFERITEYLTQVEPGKRFYAYRWLLGWFSKLGGRSLPDQQSMVEHLAKVEIDSRVKIAEVKAIRQSTKVTTVNIFADMKPGVDVLKSSSPAPSLPPKAETNKPLNQGNDSAPTIPQTEVYTVTPIEDFDLVRRVGTDATSHLIVGVPGAGKGILIANAIASVKEHHPEISVFYVDPKNDPKETGYFSNGVDFLRRANAREMSPSACIEWFKACIKEFEAIPGDKLLIFDESTLVSSKFKLGKEQEWIKDKLIGYASAGDSIGLRIWIVAQNAHTDDLGISGGIRSQFVPIALISTKNIAALGALMATQFIPKNQKLSTEEVEDIINQSPVKRAVYHGGENKWFPAKTLPNPSGYDRDKRDFLPGFKPKDDYEKADVQKLEASFSIEVETEQELPLTSHSQMSENAQKVLEFFNAATKKEPKSLRDMKKADRLAGLDDVFLIIALTELVNCSELTFNGKDSWAKSDW